MFLPIKVYINMQKSLVTLSYKFQWFYSQQETEQQAATFK